MHELAAQTPWCLVGLVFDHGLFTYCEYGRAAKAPLYGGKRTRQLGSMDVRRHDFCCWNRRLRNAEAGARPVRVSLENGTHCSRAHLPFDSYAWDT